METLEQNNSELSYWGVTKKYSAMAYLIFTWGLPFFWKFPATVTVPAFIKVAKYLRSQRGFTSIGAVGYCYGGGVLSFAGCSPDADVIDTYSIVHPGGWKFESIENFKRPVFWVFTTEDRSCTEEDRKKAEQLLDKLPVVHKYMTYEARHGFAVRGDKRDPKIRELRDDCLGQELKWFNETMPQVD